MTPAQTLCFTEVHGFLIGLFEGDLHAKRVLSLANATLGVIRTASLAVHTIGHGLALARGLLSKHAIKQVDRLLSNQGRLLLGSGVVRPRLGSRAADIWCAGKSGSS